MQVVQPFVVQQQVAVTRLLGELANDRGGGGGGGYADVVGPPDNAVGPPRFRARNQNRRRFPATWEAARSVLVHVASAEELTQALASPHAFRVKFQTWQGRALRLNNVVKFANALPTSGHTADCHAAGNGGAVQNATSSVAQGDDGCKRGGGEGDGKGDLVAAKAAAKNGETMLEAVREAQRTERQAVRPRVIAGMMRPALECGGLGPNPALNSVGVWQAQAQAKAVEATVTAAEQPPEFSDNFVRSPEFSAHMHQAPSAPAPAPAPGYAATAVEGVARPPPSVPRPLPLRSCARSQCPASTRFRGTDKRLLITGCQRQDQGARPGTPPAFCALSQLAFVRVLRSPLPQARAAYRAPYRAPRRQDLAEVHFRMRRRSTMLKLMEARAPPPRHSTLLKLMEARAPPPRHPTLLRNTPRFLAVHRARAMRSTTPCLRFLFATSWSVGGASLESARRTQVYAHRQGAVADQYRFMFKGKYVEETHTPDDVRAIAAPLACWCSER